MRDWRIRVQWNGKEGEWLAMADKNDSPMYDACGPSVESALAELACVIAREIDMDNSDD